MGLVLSALPAHAESTWVAGALSGPSGNSGTPSTAALDMRVVIPKALRVLENSYPAWLQATSQTAAGLEAHQRLVLVSTLAKGFCIDLQLSQQLSDWRLHVSGSTGTWIQPSDTGYRLCTARPGRYDVALHHDFNLPDGRRTMESEAIAWPVTVSWTAP